MAVFNPQAQYGNDPNFLNYPRVVDVPATELTKPISAASEIRSGLEGSAKFMDDAIQQGLQEKAYAEVDPKREEFTAGLEQVKKGLDQGTIAPAVRTASGASTGSNLLNSYAEADDYDLPPGLSGGIDRVQQLAMAYAAGSPRINDTSYSAATLSIAKQLRAQYPGYRQEVDEAVSRASGLPVANSYYQNLMQDINHQLMQLGRSSKDDMPGIMRQNMDVPGDPDHGVPNMGVLYQMRKTDPEAYNKLGGDAYVLDKISKWRNIQTQQTIDAKIRDQNKDNHKLQVDTETANLTKRANDVVSHFISDNISLSGMSRLNDLFDYMRQVGSTGKYNGVEQGSTEVEARAMQLNTYRAYIKSQLQSQAKGSGELIGNDQVETILEKAMSPIDGWIQLAQGSNGDKSLAGFQLRQNKNIQEEDTNRFLFNKDKGIVNRQILVGRRLFGDQYFPIFLQGALGHDISTDAAALFQQEALSAVVPMTDERGQPLPQRHLKDAIENTKKFNDIDPNVRDRMIGLVGGITDPNMPLAMKDKIIEWAFDRQNRGLVNDLRQDYRDKDGNWIPGKMAAVTRMASPAVSSAVAESAKTKPENYLKYKDAVENEFGLAFRADLATLNQTMVKVPGVHFSWNDQNGHIGLVDSNNRPIAYQPRAMGAQNPDQVYLNSMMDRLSNINRGVDALSGVYLNDPTVKDKDTGLYLLRTLQQTGFRPGENLTNASESMAKAIIKTKRPDLSLDQLDKALGLR